MSPRPGAAGPRSPRSVRRARPRKDPPRPPPAPEHDRHQPAPAARRRGARRREAGLLGFAQRRGRAPPAARPQTGVEDPPADHDPPPGRLRLVGRHRHRKNQQRPAENPGQPARKQPVEPPGPGPPLGHQEERHQPASLHQPSQEHESRRHPRLVEDRQTDRRAARRLEVENLDRKAENSQQQDQQGQGVSGETQQSKRMLADFTAQVEAGFLPAKWTQAASVLADFEACAKPWT